MAPAKKSRKLFRVVGRGAKKLPPAFNFRSDISRQDRAVGLQEGVDERLELVALLLMAQPSLFDVGGARRPLGVRPVGRSAEMSVAHQTFRAGLDGRGFSCGLAQRLRSWRLRSGLGARLARTFRDVGVADFLGIIGRPLSANNRSAAAEIRVPTHRDVCLTVLRVDDYTWAPGCATFSR